MRFLLIDRITSLKAGRCATAIKSISLSEDFFEDHFPLKPIMPGVLILEGLAQLSGALLKESARHETGRNVKALMSIVERAKFRVPARPGNTLVYRSEILSMNETGARVACTAKLGEALAAECSLVYTFHEITSEHLDNQQARLMELWTRDLQQDGTSE